MTSIKTNDCSIHFNAICYEQLNSYLSSKSISKIFVLVDENTHEHCLPSFLAQVETTIPVEIIEIESGEQHKTIDTCVGIWEALTELDADRKSLMINLGGGVITDIGGFIFVLRFFFLSLLNSSLPLFFRCLFCHFPLFFLSCRPIS